MGALRVTALLGFAALAGLARAAEWPAPLAPVPSASQLAWQSDETTLFVHFGMNTFTGRSTGLGDEDAKLFNPTEFDPRQWVRAAKQNGFKAILLTAKHHDGFCLWPTASTDHSVRSSTWRGGHGDVVREVADACREGGIKFGVYCSPWDRNHQEMYDHDPDAYSRIYRQQLTELLSNYGPIYEMWFDGNKARVSEWPAIVALVRRLQPRAVIKQGPKVTPIREDVRWVGNEEAMAPLTSWSVYPGPETKDAVWFPVESDTMMVGHWFWDGTPPRPLGTLLGFYYTSVGRNSLLLLNVAPDKRGLFSDESVRRLEQFHGALRDIFGTDFAAGRPATATDVRGGDPKFGAAHAVDGDGETAWATNDGVTQASLEIDLGKPTTFNVIRMEEMIGLGQRVSRYRVDAWDDGQWREVAQGTTIGYRKLDRIPEVTAEKVRFTVLAARAAPVICAFGLHLDRVSPRELFLPDVARAEYHRAKR